MSPATPICATSLNPTTIYYTSLESNSFILTYNNHRILVDPWLVSTLDFLTPNFSSSTKPLLTQPNPPTLTTLLTPPPSLILISQSLPDHLHIPTLKKIQKDIPIICAPSAVSLLKSLSFKSITPLSPNTSTTPLNHIKITATTGSVVGPPWQKPENGWLFTFTNTNNNKKQVYIEPHGNHPKEILDGDFGKIDGVITPVVQASIGVIGYDLVRGSEKGLELIKKVKPDVAVVLMNHVSEMKGILKMALKSKGSPEEFREEVDKLGLGVRVVVPETLKEVEIVGVGGEVEEEISTERVVKGVV